MKEKESKSQMEKSIDSLMKDSKWGLLACGLTNKAQELL